jgi:protein-tyrosine phosphatase
LNYQVSAITKRIFLGPFLSPARASYLRTIAITHVLNVGDAPNFLSASDCGFCVIHHCPVVDLQLIPDEVAIQCVDALHAMLQAPGSKAYLHCVAGQNRSPTILWLYLIACGMSRIAAKELIEAAARDAVPAHKSLVDERLASLIEEHGRRSLPPHVDASVFEPA